MIFESLNNDMSSKKCLEHITRTFVKIKGLNLVIEKLEGTKFKKKKKKRKMKIDIFCMCRDHYKIIFKDVCRLLSGVDGF